MPIKGKPIVVIDRYTMAEIVRYPSVRDAAADLAIREGTIYQSLCGRSVSHEAYFVYED